MVEQLACTESRAAVVVRARSCNQSSLSARAIPSKQRTILWTVLLTLLWVVASHNQAQLPQARTCATYCTHPLGCTLQVLSGGLGK